MDESTLRVLIGGLALAGALFLVDAAYLPALLIGPPLTGVIVARQGGQRSTAVGLWVVAGLALLAYDWIDAGEDRIFHVVVTVFTALTAWAGWAATRRVRRRAAV